MASKKVLETYLREIRKIEEHRQRTCERNVKFNFNELKKDLDKFLGVEYAKLAQDDKLTYEILHGKGQYARFLEEVEQKTAYYSGKIAKEIKKTVETTYELCFVGMVDAVSEAKDYAELKSNLKGLRAVTPDVIKNAVHNTFLEDALVKNHAGVIYDIKQQIGIGLSQGDRMSTMARRISEKLAYNEKKAMQIVRTECHRVREAGYQDASERISQQLKDDNSDYVMIKTWKTMKDLSVRPYRRKGKTFVKGKGPDHISMEGKTILVDEFFELGGTVTGKAKAPGQSGVAGHDINCRCYLSRDLITKAEYEQLTGKKLAANEKEAQLEAQEKILLDEKSNLEKEKENLIQKQENLKSQEYTGIWKDTVTPADYEAKKDSIQSKKDWYLGREDYFSDHNMNMMLDQLWDDDIDYDEFKQYFSGHLGYSDCKKYGFDSLSLDAYADDYDLLEQYVKAQAKLARSDIQSYIDMLDDFEKQGKEYIKLSKKIAKIDTDMADIDDAVKDVRQNLMKAKGIDPNKMQAEIDDLVNQINALSSKTNNLTIKSKIGEFTNGEIEAALDKVVPGTHFNANIWKDDVLKDWLDFQLSPDEQTAFKKELKKLIKNNPDDVKNLKKLQKELSDKSDELEKVRKRYGLIDDKFSQKRKNEAYWFTSDNGGAKAADAIYRPKAGEVWRNATAHQKKSAYEYTRSYSKYNEPLRGIEYGTNKYLGPGNIDLDNIGVNGYGNFKKGEVKKLIDDLTDYIDKSTYDYDIWVNRGCKRSGMDKFFGIDPSDFNLSQDELAAKILGTTPTEYGFMSTGVAKGTGFSGEVKLNIYAPKGTKMAYVEPFSAFGNGAGKSWDGISTQSSIGYEAEMLFQRNTKFRVIKVEKSGSQWYIDMEVIDQSR